MQIQKTRSSLGANLKRLRTGAGLSLREVAERSGLVYSTLWKVENEQMSLTYDKLVQLAEGLNVDIGLLFDSRPEGIGGGRRSVERAGHGRLSQTARYDYLYPNTDLIDRKLIPMFTTVKAKSLEEFGPLSRHDGEEFALVLDGAVQFVTEFYEPVELSPGDSVYYDGRMGHAFLAPNGAAKTLSVCSSPETLHPNAAELPRVQKSQEPVPPPPIGSAPVVRRRKVKS